MTPAECADLFGSAADRVIDLHPVLEEFGKHMFDSIGKNFAEHGRPKTWPPSQKNPTHTLVDTGDLFASANTIVEGESDLLLVAGGMGQPPAKAPSLQYGAKIKYKHKGGRFVPLSTRLRRSNLERWGFGKGMYQGGASKGEAVLPPRPYLLFQQDDLATFYAMATAYIFEMRGAP
jgi:phage gpG-like protein